MANNKVSGEDIVQKATQYSGIRYTPGGSNPKRGFDCSGFVSYVFRKLDISVPRSSASLFCKDKQVSDYKDLHLGDLVFSAEAAYPTRSVTWESSYQSTTKPENFHSFTLHARE